ncbi:bifunctional folylpolyglutamate synthase/dihydrofolate synthase [Bacteroidia bacterium]|nr:bifunctional folylpolyglutamate synthase/dihydrofolate synthase [Bacteroidia bacterium]
MQYTEAIDWLYSQLPIFQKQGKAAYHPGLDNIKLLLSELNNPEREFKTIHVAGTNGKGSVSHMLSAVLQTAGYKTGLYTSPHLKNFEERVKIDGKEIAKEQVVDFTRKMMVSDVKPSFFEMTVAMAFEYFAKEQVDIAIIETGMGGRLDSTNVIQPLLSIITNISLDHQQYLGDTLEKIAHEKAGIIKSNTPVVIGETQLETSTVFIQKAKLEKAEIWFADKEKLPSIESDLIGSYQTYNLKTALCSLERLIKLGFHITDEHIENGLQNVQQLTAFNGRYQQLGLNPKIIADTGHNEAALAYLIPQLLSEDFNQLHIVFGMANDKDIHSILMLLPKSAHYYFCKPNVPRGMSAQELERKAAKVGLQGETFESVNLALQEAKNKASNNDLIFVGGSTFVVAEIIE